MVGLVVEHVEHEPTKVLLLIFALVILEAQPLAQILGRDFPGEAGKDGIDGFPFRLVVGEGREQKGAFFDGAPQ